MYDFPLDPCISALRALVQSAYGLPNGAPIPESGSVPVKAQFPMGLLELDGEIAIADGVEGPSGTKSLREIESTFTVYCWYIGKVAKEQNQPAEIRAKLITLMEAVVTDRTLGGAATRARLVSANWTGQGRDWPFAVEPGVGVGCGYVGVEITILDA